MATILVTGATGFIGSNLATKLYEYGHNVLITGNSNEQKCQYTHMISNDLNDLYKFKNIDYCFHQAAHNDTTDTNEKYMYESNCLWSLKLFNILKNLNCKKIIYASSASLYGDLPIPHSEDLEINPLNVYARSKQILELISENFGKQNNITMIGLRYFNVYGVNEGHKGKRASMIYQLCKQAITTGECRIFKWGNQSRDWVSVNDIVNCNIKCLDHNNSDIFNVGSGISISVNDVIDMIRKAIGKPIKLIYIDNPYIQSYQDKTLADISKAKNILGYNPIKDLYAEIENIIKKSQTL